MHIHVTWQTPGATNGRLMGYTITYQCELIAMPITIIIIIIIIIILGLAYHWLVHSLDTIG